MRIFNRIVIGFALLVACLMFPSGARGDYAVDHPEYSRMTSRTLGMGGASVAWIDDASSIFQNPAGLGRIRSLSMSHAHSRNHFPGPEKNLDQIDSDPTSFIIPLSGVLFGYPLGSAGTGWILHGEQGYDYTIRNDESIPKEHLVGIGPGDWSEGAGFHLWPGGFLGFTHHVSGYSFAEGDRGNETEKWSRDGEGGSIGLQQTIFPGIQFGAVVDQMDYDYRPPRDDVEGERTKSVRTGWCVRPTAWLTLARDDENISTKEWPSKETSKTGHAYWGAEVRVGTVLYFRWGSFDGLASHGWSYQVGPWRSDSAWVDGFMQRMVDGYPKENSDIHITGMNVG
jgi:hypothetical protein